MRNLKILSIIPVVMLAQSCGSGTGLDPFSLPATAGNEATGKACSTPFYSEVIGQYFGQIERNGGSFYTNMTVKGADYYDFCNLNFELFTITSDPILYSDIDMAGNFITAIDTDGNQDFWENPLFPIDGNGVPNSRTKAGESTVIGGLSEQGIDVFRVTFEGDGIMTFEGSEGYLSKAK